MERIHSEGLGGTQVYWVERGEDTVEALDLIEQEHPGARIELQIITTQGERYFPLASDGEAGRRRGQSVTAARLAAALRQFPAFQEGMTHFLMEHWAGWNLDRVRDYWAPRHLTNIKRVRMRVLPEPKA
jgi:hypothetical protein